MEIHGGGGSGWVRRTGLTFRTVAAREIVCQQRGGDVDKDVMVYRFITKNTLEEKIDAMIQSKKELATMTISTGESWIGNMSDKDLKELITLTDH